jgi:hypothetical protein
MSERRLFRSPTPNPFEGCRCGERLVDPVASNLEALALEVPNVIFQCAVDGVADPVGLLAVEGVVIVGLGLGHCLLLVLVYLIN